MPVEPRNRICKNVMILFAATVFLSINTISARTDLAGNIGGMVLTADGNPYIVTKDISIPANENTVIREGCRLFFRQLTGLTVNGDLTIAGTEERPVLVTSLNDSLSPEKNGQLPNPFDWNGIIISKTAGDIKLSDFTLSYSTFGIKSQKNIFIKNGTFRQNGQFHFTIQEAIKPVVDGIPFTYATYTVAYNSNDAESGEVPVDAHRYLSGDIVSVPGNAGNLVKTDNSFAGWSKSSDGSGNDYTPGSSFMMGDSDVVLYAKWLSDRPMGPTTAEPIAGKRGSGVFVKKGVPILIGTMGVGLGGVAIWSLIRYADGDNAYQIEKNIDKQQSLKDDGKRYSAIAITTGTLSILSITGGVVLYLWNNVWSDRGKKVAVVPMVAPGAVGAGVVFRL